MKVSTQNATPGVELYIDRLTPMSIYIWVETYIYDSTPMSIYIWVETFMYIYMKVSPQNATPIPLKMLHPRLVCRINWYDLLIPGTPLLFVYTYMTVSTKKLHALHWKCYTLDSDVDSTRMIRSCVVLDLNLSMYNLNLFMYMCVSRQRSVTATLSTATL